MRISSGRQCRHGRRPVVSRTDPLLAALGRSSWHGRALLQRSGPGGHAGEGHPRGRQRRRGSTTRRRRSSPERLRSGGRPRPSRGHRFCVFPGHGSRCSGRRELGRMLDRGCSGTGRGLGGADRDVLPAPTVARALTSRSGIGMMLRLSLRLGSGGRFHRTRSGVVVSFFLRLRWRRWRGGGGLGLLLCGLLRGRY